MGKPNLFKFATSELSQDAFICWLLSWGKPDHRNASLKLHECAVALIRAFFERFDRDCPELVESVEVTKQDSRIDVLCVVNGTYVLVIEDKTNTSQHSGQLERYFKEISSRGFDPNCVLLVYFKTGDQSDYKAVESAGYTPFLRKDLLAVLNQYPNIKNEIFQDYRSSLNELEAAVQSFRTLPLDQWKRQSWIGFYSEMQKRFPDGRWDYVANPSGGFLGFWFAWYMKAYLQLEQNDSSGMGKLCFKIEAVHAEDRRAEREKWHTTIMEAGQVAGVKLKKPDRFGLGSYMTVCVLDEEYRKTKDGVLDLEATVKFVQRVSDIWFSIKSEVVFGAGVVAGDENRDT